MGFVRTYTEIEIAGILKRSEGSDVEGERGRGHAEGLHELTPVGKGRSHTSETGLQQRVLDERKGLVGAFDGCQVAAVAWAINCQAGQNALKYLNHPNAKHVFAWIDVSTQAFRMKYAQANVPKIGPIQMPVVMNDAVKCVAMKLMKENGKLHIRTAFPMNTPPKEGHSHCVIEHNFGAMPQDLTV